jgi:Protein of unknown function (DUF4019)
MHMKILAGIAALLLVACSAQTAGPAIPDAEAAAKAWLGVVDAADYARSSDTAATYLRNAITHSQWNSQVAGVRNAFGGVKSRRLSSARFARSLPGAPDGDYVIMEYGTSFERKAESTETSRR